MSRGYKKDSHQLTPAQRLHEIKRYLTHLQSYVFLAKTSLKNNEVDKALHLLEKHDAAIHSLSKLCQSEFENSKK